MAASLDVNVRAIQVALAALAAALGVLAGMDPTIAAAAALGLAFVGLVFANLAVGAAIFAGIAFLDLLPFGGASVTFAKAAGLLLALAWLAALAMDRSRENDFLAVHPVFAYLLLAFLGWAGVSLAWAEDPGIAGESVYRYGLNIVLFLIVFTAIRERRHVDWLLGAFLGGALVSAAYGLLNPADPVSPQDIVRLAGAGGDPNELAASLVAALALSCAYVAGPQRSGPVRLLAAGVMFVCATGVLLSFSRTGLVSLAAALLAAVAFGGRWRAAAVALLVVVSLGVAGYLAAYASPQQQERVTKLDGGTGRQDIWAVGWRMIEDSPTNGVGAGNFPVASIHHLLEPGALQRTEFIIDTPKVAHNIYLETWAELGLVGLAMLVAVIMFVLSCVVRAARCFRDLGDPQMELVARSTFVALVAMLAAGFFLSQQYSKQMWLLFALGPCLLALARRQSSRVATAEAT